MTGDVAVDIADAASILVLVPDVADADVKACASLLEHSGRVVDRLAAVTVRTSPTEWFRAWEREGGPSVDRPTVVDVPNLTRSAAAADAGGDSPGGVGRVETVTDTSDLADLGSTVDALVREASDANERLGICVHSLSSLLSHGDRRRVFNFVHTISDRVRAADGVVYFTLDSDCHDRETIDLLASACDAIVELDADGGLTVSRS